MFDFIINFFYIALYQPLFNCLVLLYNCIPGHDFGVAIVFLTIIIRLLLYPISIKSVKSQRALQKLQPKMQELQKKYKDDKEKQAKEVLALYQREKINPFSGILLAVIQIPILIALYQVFWNGLKPDELFVLYNFVANPGHINSLFFGLIDLSKPNLMFAFLAGLVQYFQTKMLTPNIKNKSATADFAQIMQKQMLYIFPLFTVIILVGLPSALGLYWVIGGLFSIVQQYFILKQNGTKPNK